MNGDRQEADERSEITTNVKVCDCGRDLPADALQQINTCPSLQALRQKNLDEHMNDNLSRPEFELR